MQKPSEKFPQPERKFLDAADTQDTCTASMVVEELFFEILKAQLESFLSANSSPWLKVLLRTKAFWNGRTSQVGMHSPQQSTAKADSTRSDISFDIRTRVCLLASKHNSEKQ